MSRLVLGTSDLASAKSPTTILDAAWALGITTFDVAPVYGKNGAAETALGSWLALRRIPREDVVLVGKAGHPTRNGGARLSSAELEEDVVTSLERLRTNFLDILLAHRDNEDLPVANIVEAMHALIESGRIHRWGTSNWSPPRIAAAVAAARANGWATPTVDAAQFSLAIPAIPVWPGTTAVEGDHLELYEREGIQPIVWAPLANGFLAGRWEEADRTRFPNTHYGEGRMIAAFVTPLNLERRTRLRALAAELRVTPAQAAVGFLLAHPCSPAITIGTTSVAHLQELVGGCDVHFTHAQLEYLSGP